MEGFTRWQLGKVCSVPSVNVRLCTVNIYTKLTLKAGVMDASEYALSQVVQGYRCTEAKRIDENGESSEVPTKKGYKKTNLLPYLRNRHKH